MRRIHFTHLSPGASTPVITVLSGLGGSGKTQISLKFALEFERTFLNTPIYFLNAESEASLKNDYENLIRSLGNEHRSKSHKDALTWLATKLKKWLLILDNADNPDLQLSSYIPKSSLGNVVITTRNSNHATLAPNSAHQIGGLSEDESVTLILSSSGYENNESNRALAVEIVRELGNLPLALAQAAGYIFVNKCLSKIPRYLSEEHGQNFDIVHVTTGRGLPITGCKDDPNIVGSLATRSSGLNVPISASRPYIYPTYHHCEGSRAPIRTRHGDQKVRTQYGDPPARQSALSNILQRWRMIRTWEEDNFYSMHVLVRSYLKASSTFVQNRQPCQLAVRLLGSSFTFGNSYEFLAFNRLLLPHLRLVQLEDIVEAGDYFAFGRVFGETGDWKSAMAHQEKCVEMWRASLGDEHVSTLQAKMDLAFSYRSLGRSQDASELEEKVLALRKKLLGPEHPDTLKAIHYLAWSYNEVGRKEEAMRMVEQVLEMRKGILGPEHPDTLSTMNNLANSYSQLERVQDALKLREQVLELRKRLSGPDHPDIIIPMYNLANSYSQVGRNTEAMRLRKQVLALRAKVLGLEHPGTVNAMWNLACSLENLGLKERRLVLLRIAVPAHEKTFGVDHRKTIRVTSALKKLLSELPQQKDVATS